ncbi:hypothetical protein [Myxosarcina sp. GI1]|uniref:hypothetical protein n=1 Tax=Myxosarcina sp. GI1 TaxID=1541065 RepID=UPI00055DA0B1|nr:hypothetical protein [Myxosarcina sp. GI1]
MLKNKNKKLGNLIIFENQVDINIKINLVKNKKSNYDLNLFLLKIAIAQINNLDLLVCLLAVTEQNKRLFPNEQNSSLITHIEFSHKIEKSQITPSFQGEVIIICDR